MQRKELKWRVYARFRIVCCALCVSCSEGPSDSLGSPDLESEHHEADSDNDLGGTNDSSADYSDRAESDSAVEGDAPAELNDLPTNAELPGPLLEIRDVYPAENPRNALSFYLEYQTTRPVTTNLSVSCPDVLEHRYEGDEERTAHSVFVMGLAYGSVCDLLIEAASGEERVTYETSYVTTSQRSRDIPELRLEHFEDGSTQPGWTLFTLVRTNRSTPIMVVLVDLEGRYRWYHKGGTAPWAGSTIDARPISGGLLLGGKVPTPRPTIIDWEGHVLWEAPFINHHDIRLSPFREGQLLYLSETTENCPEGTTEGTLNEFDFRTHSTVWSWNVCENYDPPRVVPDWSHINTIVPFPGERALLLSLRNQDNVVRVNRDTGEIEWVLGENGDFEMDPDDFFIRQHAPELEPNGNILLFDNGGAGRRDYSRAIELALTFDEDGRPDRAEVVWDYTNEALLAKIRSDADRLPNGNTLIDYGQVRSSRAALLLEVTDGGDVVWQLTTPPYWASYRALRVEPPTFGFVLDVD